MEFEPDKEITVPHGKTILVDGPASFTVLEGVGDLLGMPLDGKHVIVVYSGRRMPVYARDNDIIVGVKGGGNVKLIDGPPVPQNWYDSAEAILSLLKDSSIPLSVFILGGPDTGKTSMCTFLTNMFSRNGIKTAVIDADVGQSDIGPPTVVSMAVTDHPVPGLQYLEPYACEFVGNTSPKFATGAMIKSTETLVSIARESAHAIIINTDGWITKEGVEYKLSLINRIKPDIIVALKKDNELEPILKLLPSGASVMECERPGFIKPRSRSERSDFRYGSWYKYFKGSRIRKFYLDRIKILGWPPLEKNNRSLAQEIRRYVGITPTYSTITARRLWVIYLRNPPRRVIQALKRFARTRRVYLNLIALDLLEGNVVGLYNSEERTLGIGKVVEFNLRNGYVTIKTPVVDDVSAIRIGREKVPV